MTPRTWALAFGTAGGALALWARPMSNYSRVYVSVRHEADFEPLLTMGGNLVANFCILTDPTSISVSEQRKKLAIEHKLRYVDVEVDEPGVSHLAQRYAVGHIPTLIAFHGGNEIARYVVGKDRDTLDAWMSTLNGSDDVTGH